MGFFGDDDDEPLSPSDGRAFESPNAAKKEKKERKARAKGMLLALKRAVLRNTLNEKNGEHETNAVGALPSSAQPSVAAEGQASDAENAAAHEKIAGTPTLKEQEEESIVRADETPSPDELIEKAHREEQREDDEEEEKARDDA